MSTLVEMRKFLNEFDEISKGKPSDVLEKVYELSNAIRVPSPKNQEEARLIILEGGKIASKLLRAFATNFAKVEKFDPVKAQGFKTFLDSIANFIMELTSIHKKSRHISGKNYFETKNIEQSLIRIRELLSSNKDIGPDLRREISHLASVMRKKIPEIPQDEEEKSLYFKQFSEFSDIILEILEELVQIKEGNRLISHFLEEKIKLLKPGEELLESVEKESRKVLNLSTAKTGAACYILSKKLPKPLKKDFKNAYIKIKKDLIPSMINSREVKGDLKRLIKLYKGRPLLDALKDFYEQISKITNTMNKLSESISDMIYNTLETSGRFINNFIIGSNEAQKLLEVYRPLFNQMAEKMLEYDKIAFQNVLNKNHTTLDMVSHRIKMASSEIAATFESLRNNREILDILKDFSEDIHNALLKLRNVRSVLESVIKFRTISEISERLKISGNEMVNIASTVNNFFSRNFREIYGVYSEVISKLEYLREKV